MSSDERKDMVLLTHDLLSVDQCVDLVRSPAAGAISTFIGQRVLKLSYEAYATMAERQLYALLQSVRERWDVRHAVVHHRLGEVAIGEASVIIAISSCHRRESLEAVSYAIDTLKANVPIWKKEIYADGDSKWKENSECVWSSSSPSLPSTSAASESFPTSSGRSQRECDDRLKAEG